MATAIQKITLSPSRDIPFNKLVLSQSNVRRVKAGVSVEELGEDIARRGLLQGLSVWPVYKADGVETGMFEIPAGGRRYRALEQLVKQKRLAKTAPVPCVVCDGGIAEEDSLAENVQRAPLHPLDQFRAFLALRDKGQSEEEIAAAFFVSVNVVKHRLKLASVSPALLGVYAEDGMTLDQLMAFTVSGGHARQEQVFERLQNSGTGGGMSTQRNKIRYVHTGACVATQLGADEVLIYNLTLALEREDGVIWVYGLNDDDGVLAFTDDGIEVVRLLLEQHHEYIVRSQSKS